MRTLVRKRWYFIPPLIIIGITAFGFVTMTLWNALLPNILHLPVISFWQAIGLLVLSRLLFGGGPWHKGGHHQWRGHMREKWEKMTPEERERFREKLHHSHPWDNFCREHPKEEKKGDIA